MSLTPGTKLGPYEIPAPIGKGGMGEVYRANDTKLDREVAIKVLPSALAQDPERLARFEREAKVLVSLNHSDIATIYAIEDSPDGKAIAMELVDGATLKSPLPLEEALRVAAQIAEALEAAHEKGITHRDLKPANIMVTPAGTVKVLDFGLAAVTHPSGTQEGDPSQSPTLTISPTRAGMILGTAAYMSPEQARGKQVDKRADIWAFGVVLYEMITGKQLFGGETVADILAAVIHKEPDLAEIPIKARRLLQRYLEKDPKNRLRDIGDVGLLLDQPPSVSGPSHTWLRKMSWIAAALLATAAAALGFGYYRATRPVERPLMRFTDDLGAEIALARQEGPAIAISPDGSRLAYLSRGKDQMTQLAVRLIENPTSTILAGTEGAASPFFSPDGRWIGFFVGPALKKISVEGGTAVTLCEVGGGPRGGGFWGEDDNIYFASLQTPVMRVPASGGTAVAVTKLDEQKGEASNRSAQLLPGGEALLFEASKDNNTWEDGTIEVQVLKTGQRKALVQGGYFGH